MDSRLRRVVYLLSLPPGILGTLLVLLLLVNMWNPFVLMFQQRFWIRNSLPERIWVTPLGRWESGDLGILPQYCCRRPAIPAWVESERPIAPHGSLAIDFDSDDIRCTALLVRFADGTAGVQPADGSGVTIAGRTQLIPPTAEQLTIAAGSGARRFWIVTFLALVAAVAPWVARRWWKAAA